MDGGNSEFDQTQREYPLLFEMMRSFSTLARTLNLSHAVEELGSTRQTVRRHIMQLEEAFGEPLFEVSNRQYQLTEKGERELPMALDLLAQSRAWVSGKLSNRDGLRTIRQKVNNWSYYQQQHPIGNIWNKATPLVAETFRAWSLAGAVIEHPALQYVRPYLLVYRFVAGNWVCVEFGQRSFYVGWFGEAFTKSSIGRPLDKMPGGEEFARILDQSFIEVQEMQFARYEHVYTQVRRPGQELPTPIGYERLMMCGRFPDESLAVLSLILPRKDVEIDGLAPEELERISEEIQVPVDKGDIRLRDLQL